MNQPTPDPRLFQKNFAMPMNPAPVRQAVHGLPAATGSDGAHTHTITLTGSIASVTDHVHGLPVATGSDGAHTHTITLTGSIGAVADHVHGLPTTTGSDGAHTHPVTITTTAITSDSPTTRQEITIPGAVTITTATAYYTLCWRKGVFVGKVLDGGAVPAHEGAKVVETIYTLTA